MSAGRFILFADHAVLLRAVADEVKGMEHSKDCEKLSTAVAMGWSVLRVTSDHVKSGQAVDWIGKALEIRS